LRVQPNLEDGTPVRKNEKKEKKCGKGGGAGVVTPRKGPAIRNKKGGFYFSESTGHQTLNKKEGGGPLKQTTGKKPAKGRKAAKKPIELEVGTEKKTFKRPVGEGGNEKTDVSRRGSQEEMLGSIGRIGRKGKGGTSKKGDHYEILLRLQLTYRRTNLLQEPD